MRKAFHFPYDNAVLESIYNALKTEMVFGMSFDTLDDLVLELFQFVNWYNNRRLHGSLNYLLPVEFNL
ncbi:MAG: IS3 family transposase [Defluviitaleaceae bacterium]|nr:IS3 family transposase [Defluviitaleaceae bacterium]